MTSDRTKTVVLALVVAIGMMCAALLVRRLETMRPADDPNAADESLYLNGKTIPTQGGDESPQLAGDIRTLAPLRLGSDGGRYFHGGAARQIWRGHPGL